MAIEVGEVVHAMISGIVAAFVVTSVLLFGYRRAVARTMRTASMQTDLTPANPLPVQPAAEATSGDRNLTSSVTRRRLVLVYAVAFGASALVMTLPMTWEVVSESEAPSWIGLLINFFSLWAPCVVLLCVLLAVSRRAIAGALIGAGLTAMALAVVMPALVRAASGRFLVDGLATNAMWAAALFALTALPPLVLVFVSGRRRVRNVMPVALSAVILLSLLLLAYNHWQMSEVRDMTRASPLLLWMVTPSRQSLER
ncbi:MAG: hypothetical protein ACREBN_04675 [Burkholderiaceae bacterium]